MDVPLAYAQAADNSNSNLHLILIWIAVLTVAGILAFIPVGVGVWRHCRHLHLILAASIVWGALSAGVTMYVILQQFNWSKQQTMLIETGYYDPQSTGDAPTLPWKTWSALGAAYVGLIAWSPSGGIPRISGGANP